MNTLRYFGWGPVRNELSHVKCPWTDKWTPCSEYEPSEIRILSVCEYVLDDEPTNDKITEHGD